MSDNIYFPQALPLYIVAGWESVVPLPAGRKSTPPTGYTGNAPKTPTEAVQSLWKASYTDGNTAIVMPDGCLGFDVDTYNGKEGYTQWFEFWDSLGLAVPDETWISSARNPKISGIRWYRVPKGFDWESQLSSNIEVIRPGHRYSVVWPSVHPEGMQYKWYAPGDMENPTSHIPSPSELPELPAAALSRVMRGKKSPTQRYTLLGWSETQEWLEGRPNEDLCKAMQAELASAVASVSLASVHDPMVRKVHSLVHLAAEGCSGIVEALNSFYAKFRDISEQRGDRGDYHGEWMRAVIGAVSKTDVLLDSCGCDWMETLFNKPDATPETKNQTTDLLQQNLLDSIIDWDEAFNFDPDSIQYLPGGFAREGDYVSLVGDGKVGKSVFCHEWAWKMATGQEFMGKKMAGPVKVLYLDRENDKAIFTDHFRSYGATPSTMGDLMFMSFPQFRGLDTPEGGQTFVDLVKASGARVVFLDTISRFIEGDENENNTWLKVYVNAIVPLRAYDDQITIIRIDHFGKDKTKGARGGSAKTQDVANVYEMKKNKNGNFVLERTHTRSGIGPEEIEFMRTGRALDNMWAPGETAHMLVPKWTIGTNTPDADSEEARMLQIEDFVADNPGCSTRDILSHMSGKTTLNNLALQKLKDEGRINTEIGPKRATLHYITEDYS